MFSHEFIKRLARKVSGLLIGSYYQLTVVRAT